MMQSAEFRQLMQQAEFIGQQLSLIKKDIERDANSSHYPDAKASQYIERAIKLRLAFRSLAEGIEMNRNIVQNQKQKIQKRKIFNEGLNYYKTTVTDKIKECQIEVIDINQYTDKTIQLDDWNQRFQQKQQEIIQTLEEKKNGQKLYEKLITDKVKKQAQIKERKELYEKVLPAQAKKILAQVQETSKYFGIEDYQQFNDISNHDLSLIYDKINPLRGNKIVDLTYSKDQYQEIEVIIYKNDYKYYRQATLNKINISESDIKLTFACIAPHFNKVVIGLDRREDFSNQEVFQRLINNQEIRPIFISPQNQMERNINSKYVRVDWIDSLLLTGIIDPSNVFQHIRERVFCLRLTNYIIQSMKKALFFFPLNTENENPLPNNFKKIVSGSLQKISYEAYLKAIHQPEWIHKYATILDKKQSEMLAEDEDSNKANFISFLKTLKIEEKFSQNLNTHYKGTFNIHQNTLEFILTIPYSYPKQYSTITILEWRKKKEEKALNLDFPCKFQANLESKLLPERFILIERAVNHEITEFFRGEQWNNPFRMLIQLNRLLTLLGEQSQRKN